MSVSQWMAAVQHGDTCVQWVRRKVGLAYLMHASASPASADVLVMSAPISPSTVSFFLQISQGASVSVRSSTRDLTCRLVDSTSTMKLIRARDAKYKQKQDTVKTVSAKPVERCEPNGHGRAMIFLQLISWQLISASLTSPPPPNRQPASQTALQMMFRGSLIGLCSSKPAQPNALRVAKAFTSHNGSWLYLTRLPICCTESFPGPRVR